MEQKQYKLIGQIKNAGPYPGREGAHLASYGFDELPDRINFDPQFKAVMEAYHKVEKAIGDLVEKGLVEKTKLQMDITANW